jgi:DnaK suppressor protein
VSTAATPKKVTANAEAAAPVAKSPERPAAPAPPPRHAARPVPIPPARRPKPELNKRDLEKLRAQLEREREELVEEAANNQQEVIELDGADSGFDDEYGDAGTVTFEREKQASLDLNLRDLIEQTDRALRAMDDGTYGLCETCGNAIAKERLLALPRVTQCRDCKQRDERFR